MKKKLLSICAVAALGAFTAVGFNLQNTSQLSDVTLANIEAVAGGEGVIIIGSSCALTRVAYCVFPPITYTDKDGNEWTDGGRVEEGEISSYGDDGAYQIAK